MTNSENYRRLLAMPFIAAVFTLSACSSSPERPSGVERVRSELTALQSDPQLAGRAPIAIREAEMAVTAAENAEEDSERRDHLVFIADHRVDIARAQATQRMYVDQREQLREERDSMRLEARTDEAEQARRETQQFAMQADATREETERLKRQIKELNAKPTDRGLVLTLSDVLFETGDATLKVGAYTDLDKLVDFLNEYEERDIRIMGHTDSIGDEDYNMGLSQRRAAAVKDYLVSQGIGARRVVTNGRGESMPVANNDTAAGRQLNRRVEILIENPSVAASERRRR